MANNENKTFGAGKAQVFELTMDNPEDQDELNRRLRKPGEPTPDTPAKFGGAGNSPPSGAQGRLAENE